MSRALGYYLRGSTLAMLVLPGVACTLKESPAMDSARAAADTPQLRADSGNDAPAVRDSLVGVLPEPSLPVVPVRRRGPVDTTSVFATDAELRELAAQLIIPLPGVKPGELHDMYAEARGGRVHEAIDILAPRNTPVLAATAGTLLKLHDSRAGGLMVYTADASDRFILMYGHLERYADGLSEGMPLRQGQLIGYVGTSGNAAENTPHLHFAIARGRPSSSWWHGTPINPYPLLAR